MNIIDRMSSINYEVFVSLIDTLNEINDRWSIKLDDSGWNNHVKSNISICDKLLVADEATITNVFENNDRIIVQKSFDEYRISYQGSGKYLNVYEALLDKIAEESKTISSERANASSAYRFLNSSI